MKHVTTSVNDYISVEDSTKTNIENDLYSNDISTMTTTSNLATKVDKKKFQERYCRGFVQMVENSSIIVKKN